MEQWLTSKQFREKYGISVATLWRRANIAHTVKTKVLYGTTYYLDEEASSCKEESERINVIYIVGFLIRNRNKIWKSKNSCFVNIA